MHNVYEQFRQLLPDAPLQAGTVTEIGAGVVTVQLPVTASSTRAAPLVSARRCLSATARSKPSLPACRSNSSRSDPPLIHPLMPAQLLRAGRASSFWRLV